MTRGNVSITWSIEFGKTWFVPFLQQLSFGPLQLLMVRLLMMYISACLAVLFAVSVPTEIFAAARNGP